MHATTTEGTLLGLDVFREVAAGSHLTDEFGTGIIGMGGEDAVDVREQDEGVCLHHLGDEAGELVVIRKHQLCDADGVVLAMGSTLFSSITVIQARWLRYCSPGSKFSFIVST